MFETQRRLRQNRWVRELCKEVRVTPESLIQPLFIVEGIKERENLPGLTGVYRDTPDTLLKQIENDLEKGVRKFLLFGVPQHKASFGFKVDFAQKNVENIKKRFGQDLWLSVDVCLCSYTDHGHCGVVNTETLHVENSSSVEELARIATAYAQAGADCVAPSDMMDGRVSAIRGSLDDHGLNRTLIMSYSAKFSSKFYGPFRVAADCAPKHSSPELSNRATYQIDPAHPTDALASALRDADEGADILMVKPGLPYLDILYKLSLEIPKPWAVYEVSGEYAGIELLGQNGLMDARLGHVESWTSLTRAGAQMIITYGARNAREWLALV